MRTFWLVDSFAVARRAGETRITGKLWVKTSPMERIGRTDNHWESQCLAKQCRQKNAASRVNYGDDDFMSEGLPWVLGCY